MIIRRKAANGTTSRLALDNPELVERSALGREPESLHYLTFEVPGKRAGTGIIIRVSLGQLRDMVRAAESAPVQTTRA